MIKLLTLFCLSAMVLLQSCALNGNAPAAAGKGVANPELHALMAKRINVLISQMDALMTDQIRTETELDQARKQNAISIADSAEDLQRAATQILSLQPKLALDADDAPVFHALAVRLRGQGEELEALARRNQIDALRPAMARTKDTCMACHTMFRSR